MSKFSNVIGAEKTPVENVLLTFCVTDVVKAKLPCVSPPPVTSCKPTISSEKLSLPLLNVILSIVNGVDSVFHTLSLISVKCNSQG